MQTHRFGKRNFLIKRSLVFDKMNPDNKNKERKAGGGKWCSNQFRNGVISIFSSNVLMNRYKESKKTRIENPGNLYGSNIEELCKMIS